MNSYQYIKNLRISAENLYALLENLLTWSRIQRGAKVYKPISLDLGEVVKKMLALYRSQAEHKQIALRSTIPPQTSVYADRHMIETVVRNLLSNALKSTSAGGRIVVSARPREKEVEIAVADSGTGIDPKALPKLFRIDIKYTQRGTEGERGTGLGLSLCKDLVQKNGGDIWVESVLNQGTTFRFTVPKQPV